MKQRLASLCLMAAEVALPGCAARASNFYVAPEGSASGPGSKAKPYDLTTALSGSTGNAGDTFWLRQGIYRIGHVDTEIHGSPGKSIIFRQMPGERTQVVGSLTLHGKAGYLISQGFELYSGSTRRLSKQ